SELGILYGRKCYNILGFRKDTCGKDGVISLEGSLFGLAGSTLIGLIYCGALGFGPELLLIIVAGTIGNLTDSFLGATLERSGILKNNGVNFLNTLIAAMSMLLLCKVFGLGE
ncbi:MAG: DUF92 domain-containing protein, partial [Sphingobacteriales bacterium]